MDLTLIEGPEETLQIINNDAVIQTVSNEAVVIETAFGTGATIGGGSSLPSGMDVGEMLAVNSAGVAEWVTKVPAMAMRPYNARGPLTPNTSYAIWDTAVYKGRRILFTQNYTTGAGVNFVPSANYVTLGTNAQFYASDWDVNADGANDQASKITAALQHISTNMGGGTLVLPQGPIMIGSKIDIPNNVTLEGQGIGYFGTEVKLLPGSNCDAFSFHVSTGSGNANAFWGGIRNMRITGNKNNQSVTDFHHGINVTTNPYNSAQSGDPHFDPAHMIQNVMIKDFTGHGYFHYGRSDVLLNGVHAQANNGTGFVLSFDTNVVGCSSAFNGTGGFSYHGSSTRTVGSKSYNNGKNVVWASTGTYVQGQTVYHAASGAMYRAVVAIASSDTTVPGTDASKWLSVYTDAPYGAGYAVRGGYGAIVFAGCDAQQNTGSGLVVSGGATVAFQGSLYQSNFDNQGTNGVQSTNPNGFYNLVVDNAKNCIIDAISGGANAATSHAKLVNNVRLSEIRVTGDVTSSTFLSTDSMTLIGSTNSVRFNGKSLTARVTDNVDVLLASLADGDVLSWDAASSKWVNKAVVSGGGGATTVAGITDYNSATGMAPQAVTTTDKTATANQTVMGDASQTSRSVFDGVVTNASTAFSSATANFTSADVGKPIYGLGITAGATIASVQSATAATLSVNSYAGVNPANVVIGSGQLNITLPSGAADSTRLRVEKVDATSRPVVLVAPSGESIVNNTPMFTKGQARTLIKTGTTWYFTENYLPLASETRGGTQQISRGAIISATGDSIGPGFQTFYGTTGGGPASWLTWTHLYSNGKLQIGKLDAIGSTRGDQITSRFHHMLGSGPAHFVVCDPSYTNSASAGFTSTQIIGFLKTQCDAAIGQGAMPVLHTGYPVPSAYRALTDTYRRAVIAFARRNGYILIDTFQSLYDPTTGGYLAAYDSGDGVHPNNSGKKVIGLAAWQAIAPYVVGFAPMPQYINDSSTSSLLSNGLFITDTNSDGVPDGLTKAGNVTATLVTDSEILGKAVRLTDTANSGYTQLVTGNISGTTTGRGSHLISFTGRVNITGGSFTVAVNLNSPTAGQSRSITPVAWTNGTEGTDGWKTFYGEMVAPADCNGISLSIISGGGTAVDAKVAQLRIDDLTNGGIV